MAAAAIDRKKCLHSTNHLHCVHYRIYIAPLQGGLLRSTTNPSQHGRIKQIWVVEGMIESRFWEESRKTRGYCSRLRDQAPRKHNFPWWRSCRQKELEGDLLSRAKGMSAQSIVLYLYIYIALLAVHINQKRVLLMSKQRWPTIWLLQCQHFS